MIAWLIPLLAVWTLSLSAAVDLLPARTSPSDLEVSGSFPGGRTNGFLTRTQLLALPQSWSTNAQDLALKTRAVYRGVALTDLRAALQVDPASDILFAVCTDGYSASFPADYLAAFRSLLILEINGKGPDTWGKSHLTGLEMAPFYVNAGEFKPRPEETVLGNVEAVHFPYGVVRIEFRAASRTLDRLRLRPGASEAARNGEKLVLRDCLSCHGHEDFGGLRSGRPWLLLKTWSSNTNYFRRYVVNPQSVQPASRMPAFKAYNAATLDALQAYFRELRIEDLRR
jgi:hypothetical protein